jgi:hypothetical protein
VRASADVDDGSTPPLVEQAKSWACALSFGRLSHPLEQSEHVGHLPLGARAREHALELGAEGRALCRGRVDVRQLASEILQMNPEPA